MPVAMPNLIVQYKDLFKVKALELGRVGPRTILFVSTRKAFAKNSKGVPPNALIVQVTDEDYDEVLDALNKLVPRTGKSKIEKHSRGNRFFGVRLAKEKDLPPAARVGNLKEEHSALEEQFFPPQPSSNRYVVGGVTTAALAGAFGVYNVCHLPPSVISTMPGLAGLAAKCAPSALQAARAYVGV